MRCTKRSALACNRTIQLALLLVLIGCGSSEPLRIGVVASGEAVAGAKLAVTDVNEAGGVNGRQLELRVMSAGGSTDPKLAIITADSLIRDESVIAVIGHANSASSISASQLYNQAELVQIAPTSSAPLLTKVGPWTFRMVPSDIHQGRFLAEKIAQGGARPRVAIAYTYDDYGRALYSRLIHELERLAVPVVYEAPYQEGSPLSAAPALSRALLEADAEVLVWLGRPNQLRDLLGFVRGVMPDLRVIASDGLDNSTSRANRSGVMTGVQHTCFVDPELTPELRELSRRALAAGDKPLTAEGALIYDAVKLLAAAANEAGSSRIRIRDWLSSVGQQRPPFEGVTGRIAFDQNGDPEPRYCLHTIAAPPAATR